MVASPGPGPGRHQSLLHQQNQNSVVMQQQYNNSSKPAPPRTPPNHPGGGGGRNAFSSQSPSRHGGSSPAPSNSNNNNNNNNSANIGGSLGGGSLGGSLASRGSNNTRPSSSPEGRSVRTSGDGSKGSMENQREAAAGDGPSSSLAVDGPVRPSLAINTTLSPMSATNNNSSVLLAPNNSMPMTSNEISNSISNSNSNNTSQSQSTPPKTKGIPKNPRDTVAYISPGGLNNAAGGGGLALGGGQHPHQGAAMSMAMATGAGHNPMVGVGGASPKRRMKSLENRDYANFGLAGVASASGNASGSGGNGNNFGGNFAANNFAGGVAVGGSGSNIHGGGNSFVGSGGANFAGSGGGSVGVGNKVLTGGQHSLAGGSVGAGSNVGGKSVKSVPTGGGRGSSSSPYGHHTVGYHHAGGAGPVNMGGHGQRMDTPSSSLLLNDLTPVRCNTPGSTASHHSTKDLHGNSNIGTIDTSHNSSMPNIHNNPQNQHNMAGGPPHNSHNNNRTKKDSLDDEEQFMFEQRLTQDELGVAIRKISHSGKAQLRYVKCVPLRPPSSSDFEENYGNCNAVLANVGSGLTSSSGGGLTLTSSGVSAGGNNMGGSIGGSRKNTLPYLDPHTGRSSKPPSDSISVSSKSSTGSRFMERMRSTSSGMRRLIPNNNNNNNNNSATTSATLEERAASDTLLLQNEVDKGDKSSRALTWGKKNAVTLSLDKFTCVRKGKTTERTIRNSSPSSRLLSIITSVRGNESLDIEAPTMLDRDKFASAFARFLGVPLVEEEGGRSRGVGNTASKKKIRTPSLTRSKKKLSAASSSQQLQQQRQPHQHHSAALSEPGPMPSPSSTPKVRNRSATNSDSLLPALTPTSDKASEEDRQLVFNDRNNDGSGHAGNHFAENKQTIGNVSLSRKVSDTDFSHNAPVASAAVTPTAASAAGNASLSDAMSKHTMETMSASARKRISHDLTRGESMLEPSLGTGPPQDPMGASGAVETAANNFGPNGPAVQNTDQTNNNDNDNQSHVSSLTGGVDQEIVEELHQAIIELRSELDASRAEAARAVKVAEQAIQSAENCTSSNWNSTVTHKAAEAAAQAQKKSAEAIARARMAEERLASERKSTSFWRRQAQAAEEESGSLKTRSAATEVKQAVMMEELASERRKAARMFASLKSEFVKQERKQGEEMTLVQERKRALEVELNDLRGELEEKSLEVQRKEETGKTKGEKLKGPNRMVANFRSSRSSSQPRPKRENSKSRNSPSPVVIEPENEAVKERCLTLQTEVTSLRKQFELVRHTSMDEILSLHRQSEEWSNQASRAVAASTAETDHLREKFAAESAMRLKLLNELQDIRGTVRVYCRPKPVLSIGGKESKSVLKIPTHDILVLNEDAGAMSFKYDRVFAPGASHYEVFSELEEPLISSLDGFNVTLLAFGAGDSGKTHTLLGKEVDDEDDNVGGEEGDEGSDSSNLRSLKSYGVQLQAIEQLFTIASHRTDRYKDSFSMTMVEVHNEKLFDLVAGTPFGERDGEVVVCETRDSRREKRNNANDNASWRKGKLEIRTNIDGNTVVQGQVSVPISSFDDAVTLLKEADAERAERLQQQDVDLKKHERKTNVITCVHITSINVATGVGTEGKLQFVDMAAGDILSGGNKKVRDDASINRNMNFSEEDNTQFANKSIEAFNDVINARCQFDRSVPYRNSTLTHLLRDSLEADTKVLLMCCVSSEKAQLSNTMGVLKFASRMQKVSIGKATKHIIGSKE